METLPMSEKDWKRMMAPLGSKIDDHVGRQVRRVGRAVAAAALALAVGVHHQVHVAELPVLGRLLLGPVGRP